MPAKYANFMSQRSSHNLSPKAKSSSIRKILTSGFISKSRVKVLPRESHLTSVWRSKNVCRLTMSSHNILNSLVFLGPDLIKLIIFTLSSKTSFREDGIFFTARAWRWRTQWLMLHSLIFCFILEITPTSFQSWPLRRLCTHQRSYPMGCRSMWKIHLLIWKFQRHLC